MQPNTPEENIFTVKPPEPTRPQNAKRSTVVGIIITILLAVLVVGGLFLIVLTGAQTAATNYKTAAKTNLEQVLVKAKAISVSEIANRRDVTREVAAVQEAARQHPRLEPSPLAAELSNDYRQAVALQQQNTKFLDKLAAAVTELPRLTTYNEGVEQIKSELDALLISTPAEPTAAQARVIAGTIDTLTQKIRAISAPQPLVEQRQIVQQVYERLAESYRQYATTKDDKGALQEPKRSIAIARQGVQDASIADTVQKMGLFMQELLQEGETLKNNL